MTDPRAVKDMPIGSGPYRVVKHVPDQLYQLVANPNYFGGQPLVDEIDMPIIKDTSAMFLALRSGQIDAASANSAYRGAIRFGSGGLESGRHVRLQLRAPNDLSREFGAYAGEQAVKDRNRAVRELQVQAVGSSSFP